MIQSVTNTAAELNVSGDIHMKKALIVDDEEEICWLLKYQLRKMGIESAVAHSLSQGLASYENCAEVDVVFLDINLPDGNGLDIIPLLKDKNNTIKIIVISAYDSKFEVEKAYELGIYQFLGKPFSKNTISQLIGKIEESEQ